MFVDIFISFSNKLFNVIYGYLLHEPNNNDLLKVRTKLQKLNIIGECHWNQSGTKNACDECVAIEANSDSRLPVYSSLLDEDGNTIE